MLTWLSSPPSLRKNTPHSPTLSHTPKSPPPATQARNHVSEGIILMRRGDIENASIMFQKAITLDRECSEAYIYKALSLESLASQEDAEDPIVLYTAALQLNPNDLMARYGMSCVKEKNGDLHSTYAIRDAIRNHKAKTVTDYKAQALCTPNNGKKYLSLLSEANKICKEDPSIHYLIAQYWLKEKEYIKSLSATIKALDIDPEYVDACSLKGDILYKMDQCSDTLIAYKAALKVNPRDIHSLTSMAKVLNKNNEYKQSLELSQEIIKLDPTNHLGYSYIAASLNALGNTSDALDAINQALKLQTNNVLYYCQRAYIYIYLHKNDCAVKDLNKAFELHNQQHTSPRSDKDSIANFVESALDQRAALIEKLTKLSSASLETLYGAEEKYAEATELQEERKALITDVVEYLDCPRKNTIEKLHEKTELILSLQHEISCLRKEKNSELLQKIESNEHLTRYLHGFELTWSQTFTASQSVTSGLIKINTDHWVTTAASLIVSFIPFGTDILSNITQVAGEFIIKTNILQHANNFVQVASNHTRMDILSEAVGMKAAIYYKEKICNPIIGKPQATNWWNQIINTITNIEGVLEDNVFGTLYPSYEAKLGHCHASKIIEEISKGKVDLSHKSTLPDKLFNVLLGMEDTHTYIY